MLNRRILRIKAMQALYSYFTAEESLKEVVQERLESKFYPDPAKDDFSEADIFTERRKKASTLFSDQINAKDSNPVKEEDEEIAEAVQSAVQEYSQSLSRERSKILKDMMGDVEGLHQLYLKILSIPLEFSHIEKLEKEKKEKAYIHKESPWKWHFIDHPLLDDLTKFEPFTKELINQKIDWSEHLDQLKSWYKDILKKDEQLMAYQQKVNPSNEEHKEAILHLMKKIIFKNDSINEFLSEMDLHWVENKSILKSLVVKTYQDYEPSLDPPFELKEVSKNAEEDFDFFETLYRETLDRNDELDNMIEKRIKNWDISRVALTDRIILKMALVEMMTFHGIPVKVTINEFIEISKQYSTPKSKQFVNGILDVLANELTSEGVIRKSGRGLIDNK